METINAEYLYQQLDDEHLETNQEVNIDNFVPKFCGRQLSFVNLDTSSEHEHILNDQDPNDERSLRMSSVFPTLSRFSSLLSQDFDYDKERQQREQLMALANEHGISEETIDQCGKNLTTTHFVQVKAMFDYIDQDSSGFVSIEEFGDIFHRVGNDAGFDKDEFLQEIDRDGDGQISFSEFLIMMSGSLSLQFDRRDIKKAFQTFAEKGNLNKVDVNRLGQILKRIHCVLGIDEEVPRHDIDRLLQHLPVDSDGYMDVDQFLNGVGLTC